MVNVGNNLEGVRLLGKSSVEAGRLFKQDKAESSRP